MKFSVLHDWLPSHSTNRMAVWGCIARLRYIHVHVVLAEGLLEGYRLCKGSKLAVDRHLRVMERGQSIGT